jgi:hypothetical protein
VVRSGAAEAGSGGSVGHVEVFRMGSVRTSILGRPRRLPRQRRANRLYTLNCEEPVTLVGLVGAMAPETYEWTVWGSARSYRLTNWAELAVDQGSGWETVALTGEQGSEATRLTQFAALVRGGTPAHLADLAAAYQVQQVVETVRAGVIR